jgi:branched-chain amino acid transport system substrate-binding protein
VQRSTLRAAAALPLTGRYGALAIQAARGLCAWAVQSGVRLTIEDCGDEPAEAARCAEGFADHVDVLFGPYGSGAMRAVAEALAGRPVIVWNHGGAATDRTGAWIVDVLAPAERYWAGLADVLGADGVDLHRVAILHGAGGFGQAVGAGAIASLRAAGAEPLMVTTFDAGSAAVVAVAALDAGATAIIGCGRFDDDIALGTALRGAAVAVGLVACGVTGAQQILGDAIVGWFGPSQWLADRDVPAALGSDWDYPAAQAYACGLIAERAIAAAATVDASAVWDAVRSLRTATFFGPFAIDDEGRQVGHSPLLIRWAQGANGPTRQVVWRSRWA